MSNREDYYLFVRRHTLADEVQRNQDGEIVSTTYHSPLWISEDAKGHQCDIPECENAAQVMKLSRTDEKIWLCYEHKELTSEVVIERHAVWLQSLSDV